MEEKTNLLNFKNPLSYFELRFSVEETEQHFKFEKREFLELMQ